RARRRRSAATSTWPRRTSASGRCTTSPMAEAILQVENLSVRYGSVPAVRGVSFEVGRGEIVGLIGPNGAGKSTTLHAIVGLLSSVEGDVRLAGQSIRGRKPETIARSGLALVP